MTNYCILSAVLIVFLSGFNTQCLNPNVTSTSFTTQDATIVTHIGFISEFTVVCDSGQVSSLFAALEDGSIVPAAIVGPQTFQVSWTEEIESSPAGHRNIRIFDEKRYSALRKALRDNQSASAVPEFFSVSVNHPGAYSGPWVRSEFIAVLIALSLSYLAIVTKVKIAS